MLLHSPEVHREAGGWGEVGAEGEVEEESRSLSAALLQFHTRRAHRMRIPNADLTEPRRCYSASYSTHHVRLTQMRGLPVPLTRFRCSPRSQRTSGEYFSLQRYRHRQLLLG